jgi:alpha-galactosidase
MVIAFRGTRWALAVERDLPVLSTDVTARDVADVSSPCPWNPDNYGLDHSHPGAQAYYDTQVAQLAAWGVDFIKADDMLWPYHAAEIEAFARAIARSGRPIELSLSPGRDVSLTLLGHLREHSTMWRVSDDLWDRWEGVEAQFSRLARWAPHSGPDGWADADMLPLGHIGIRAERGEDRHSRLTPAEQVTLMTLWVIARSPLMMGGDLPTSSPETIALLTNDAVLDVHRETRDSREVLREGDLVLWAARGGDPDVPRFAAAFHLGPARATVRLRLDTIDGRDGDRVTDLWSGAAVEVHDRHVELRIEPHGARLLRLTP